MKVKAKKIEGRTSFVTDLSNLLIEGNSKEIMDMSEEYNKLIQRAAEEIVKYYRDKKVRHLHLVGELIYNFELKFSEKKIEFNNLRKNISEDLEVSQSRLDYFTRFYKVFDRSSLNDTLSWGIYRELIDIRDETKRRDVLDKLRSGVLITTDDIREFKKNY